MIWAGESQGRPRIGLEAVAGFIGRKNKSTELTASKLHLERKMKVRPLRQEFEPFLVVGAKEKPFKGVVPHTGRVATRLTRSKTAVLFICYSELKVLSLETQLIFQTNSPRTVAGSVSCWWVTSFRPSSVERGGAVYPDRLAEGLNKQGGIEQSKNHSSLAKEKSPQEIFSPVSFSNFAPYSPVKIACLPRTPSTLCKYIYGPSPLCLSYHLSYLNELLACSSIQRSARRLAILSV